MLTFEEFEKQPEDATIYVIVAGELVICEKADLHTYKIPGMFDREVPSIPLYRRADLILWSNCFLTQQEAQACYEAQVAGWGFAKGRGVVTSKDTIIPQRSTCGVPYVPPRLIELPFDTCKKILLCKQTKLIENFPRLCLDYALAVEGQEPFATIRIVKAECFDLAGMIDGLKYKLERVRDSIDIGSFESRFSEYSVFCYYCGFDSVESFVKQYENAPSCSYYLHTIELLKVDASAEL